MTRLVVLPAPVLLVLVLVAYGLGRHQRKETP